MLRRAWHAAAPGGAELVRQGAEYGSEATLRAAEDANRYEPELHTHSRTGQRTTRAICPSNRSVRRRPA
jgi:hypothetical protein